MTFYGARFGPWGEKIDSWEQQSETFRGLYPAFRAPQLGSDVSRWPPCELKFPKPFDDFVMSWLPMQTAAVAFFSVHGIGILAHCAIVSGRATDHLALSALHQVLVTAWQPADVEISRDILGYTERPAILLVSWAHKYPAEARKVNSFAHCLASKFFEELQTAECIADA